MSAKRKVTITHPERVYFPTGFTKRDMIGYYAGIAGAMLPHLKNRPVTLIRFPEGVKGESFYEKNAPRHAPDWIKTAPVPRRKHEGVINYILIDNVETLAWCANLGAIEFHPFLHRAGKLEQPTHLAFDLDPGEGADLLRCVEVGFLLKDLFGQLGLEVFPKVTGSKGLQLYLPLHTPTTYAVATPFAKSVAELMERRHPKLIVSAMSKALRKGRVMIDWSQNSGSKTTVCAYSLRGKREEPFVSTPVTWEELARAAKKKDRDSLYFSPDDVLKRVRKDGDLFAPVLSLKQKLPKAFLKLDPEQVGRAVRMASFDPTDSKERRGGERGKGDTATAEAAGKAKGGSKSKSTPRSGSLRRYAEKRDFSKTAEPAPGKVKPGADQNRFVIQKHAASHLHFDFRLEMDGTLKSWAVPKGLPYELGVKRSAFEVEDHPVSYIDFEGTIPRGQYGGGTVMVWDQGSYELLGGNLGKGDLKLRLHGRKLKGEWHIFRIRSDDDKPVWLIAKSGVAMKPLSQKRENTSVVTGRTMERIAKENDREWKSHR